jgi:hypothetical protein
VETIRWNTLDDLKFSVGWFFLWLVSRALGDKCTLDKFLTINGWKRIDRGLYVYEGVE